VGAPSLRLNARPCSKGKVLSLNRACPDSTRKDDPMFCPSLA